MMLFSMQDDINQKCLLLLENKITDIATTLQFSASGRNRACLAVRGINKH